MIPVHGVVLAAGTGSRMPQLVSMTPKALLPILNKPMFHHPLETLLSAGVTTVTIIVPESHQQHFQDALQSFNHPSLASAKIDFRPAAAGTAESLRDIAPLAADILVLPADYIGDIPLSDLLAFHVSTDASFTAALTQTPKLPVQKSKSKPAKKQVFPIDHYTILAGTKLHAVIRPTDIQHMLTVQLHLLNTSDLLLRSDLFDPHVYVIHHAAVNPILQRYKSISSLRFDLLPYLARRQGFLPKRADGEPFTVQAYISDASAARANTAEEFLKVNLAGISTSRKTKGKEKGKEKVKGGAKVVKPFEQVGERVNVSESLVKGGKAGDKVSVKKSVVGFVTLESGVKVNGCVVMDDVLLRENVNLSGCILSKGAIVEEGVTLKDCRVAEGITVPADAEGQDFVSKEGGWADDIDFFC